MSYALSFLERRRRHTPMDNDAAILSLYRRHSEETGIIIHDTIYNLVNIGESKKALPTNEILCEEVYSNDFIRHYAEFLEKWNHKKNYFSEFEREFVFDKIKEIIDQTLQMKTKYINFELTDDCSVFFQSEVNDNNFYLELYFTHDVRSNVEAVVNVFKNKKNIFAYGGQIEDVFSKVHSKFSQKRSQKVIPTESVWEIPQMLNSTTAF